MWKIIALTLFVCNILFFNHSEFVILILDDCQDWDEVPNNALKDKSDFIYSKYFPDNLSVSIGNRWYEPKPKPSTQSMSFPEIIKMGAILTSELDYHDWRNLESIKDQNKIFVLKPNDFCSEKRFLFNHQFTLYEITFSVSAPE
jgi:hypothetical protein